MSMQMVCLRMNFVFAKRKHKMLLNSHTLRDALVHTINGNRSAKRIIKIDSWPDGIFQATNLTKSLLRAPQTFDELNLGRMEWERGDDGTLYSVDV